jgi:Predicted nucleotidyltransferase
MYDNISITGIICEFNPLHHGHKRILEHAKSFNAPIICVLSGNFVQRGEPAVIDKWSRAKMALLNGANLVIELPLPWAMSRAEQFAYGAVYLLNSLNIPGRLLFGSECGNSDSLEKIADTLLSENFSGGVGSFLKKGSISFANARTMQIKNLLGAEYADIIGMPNNTLGIEYIKAVKRLSSPLSFATLQRIGAGHDRYADSGQIQSAKEIREILYRGNIDDISLPESTKDILKNLCECGRCPASISYLERAILSKLRSLCLDNLKDLPDLSEGLEHRIHSSIQKACSLEELYCLIKSKRYSHARIRRLILSAFLGISKKLPAEPPYIRVLGMDKIGESVIKSAKPSLPFVFRSSDVSKLSDDAQKIFQLESDADNQYALAFPKILPFGSNCSIPIVKN